MDVWKRIRDKFFNDFPYLFELADQNRLSLAIKICYELLKAGEDPRIRIILSHLLASSGFTTLSDLELSKAIGQIKEGSLAYLVKGETLLSRDRLEEGRLYLETYLALNPEDHGARERLQGVSALLERDYLDRGLVETPSLQAEEEELPLEDINTPALAEIYFEQGALEDAIRVYEAYLQKNPGDHTAKKRLEELLGSKGMPVKTPEGELVDILERWLRNYWAQKECL